MRSHETNGENAPYEIFKAQLRQAIQKIVQKKGQNGEFDLLTSIISGPKLDSGSKKMAVGAFEKLFAKQYKAARGDQYETRELAERCKGAIRNRNCFPSKVEKQLERLGKSVPLGQARNSPQYGMWNGFYLRFDSRTEAEIIRKEKERLEPPVKIEKAAPKATAQKEMPDYKTQQFLEAHARRMKRAGRKRIKAQQKATVPKTPLKRGRIAITLTDGQIRSRITDEFISFKAARETDARLRFNTSFLVRSGFYGSLLKSYNKLPDEKRHGGPLGYAISLADNGLQQEMLASTVMQKAAVQPMRQKGGPKEENKTKKKKEEPEIIIWGSGRTQEKRPIGNEEIAAKATEAFRDFLEERKARPEIRFLNSFLRLYCEGGSHALGKARKYRYFYERLRMQYLRLPEAEMKKHIDSLSWAISLVGDEKLRGEMLAAQGERPLLRPRAAGAPTRDEVRQAMLDAFEDYKRAKGQMKHINFNTNFLISCSEENGKWARTLQCGKYSLLYANLKRMFNSLPPEEKAAHGRPFQFGISLVEESKRKEMLIESPTRKEINDESRKRRKEMRPIIRDKEKRAEAAFAELLSALDVFLSHNPTIKFGTNYLRNYRISAQGMEKEYGNGTNLGLYRAILRLRGLGSSEKTAVEWLIGTMPDSEQKQKLVAACEGRHIAQNKVLSELEGVRGAFSQYKLAVSGGMEIDFTRDFFENCILEGGSFRKGNCKGSNRPLYRRLESAFRSLEDRKGSANCLEYAFSLLGSEGKEMLSLHRNGAFIARQAKETPAVNGRLEIFKAQPKGIILQKKMTV